MTIGRSKMSNPRFRRRLNKRYERLHSKQERRLHIERLESRQLLAVGPQLAGIQPNDGALLENGQVRDKAPLELVFHFNAGQSIEPTSVGAVRLARSGGDGAFERAHASSDFNTNGAAVLDFEAVQPSLSGNGISIEVIKNNLGTGAGPNVTVIDEAIRVELNTNAGTPTLARQLRDAINNNVVARTLVDASVRAGTNQNANIASPNINYSPIVLDGANRASASTDFNAGSRLQVTFTSVPQGLPGNGIEIAITRTDRGGVSPPRITVDQLERIVRIDLNSNSAQPTTAQELIDAVNNHAEATTLITARLDSGSQSTTIGDRLINFAPLQLNGANDINIVPGFVGLGDTPRQVVFRFQEPLPDDLYLVEVIGTGASALRNVTGDALGDDTDDGLDNGRDVTLEFELDLGAHIVAVVPQPTARQGNTLVQQRDAVHVYFNDDDLHNTAISTNDLNPNPTVVDPAFYQLISTNDTVQNTDDTIFFPQSIDYDPGNDRAVLHFASDLDLLGAGPGTFRLKIGTDEAMLLVPIRTDAAGDPGSSFDSARTVGVELGVIGGGTALANGQTFSVTNDATSATTTTFTFDDGTGPGGANTVLFDGNMDQRALATSIVNAINAANLGVSAAVGGGDRLALTGASQVSLGAGVSALQVGSLNSLIVSSEIQAQPFNLQFPGDNAEPGGRQLPAQLEQHLFTAGDSTDGVTTIFYNFQQDIGFDPQGNPLLNLITDAQRDRAREGFQLYGEEIGAQFVESPNQGFTIATGDMRAIIPNVITGPGGVFSASVFGGPGFGIVIMDAAERWDDSFGATDDVNKASWFEHAASGIGTLLGVGLSSELPPLTLNTVNTFGENVLLFDNQAERVYPGDHDLVHAQNLFRPEGQDIDLFRVEVPQNGLFSAEVTAERLSNSSLLDSVLTLFRQTPNGRELIARNDDYFSNDSFIELELQPGTYWVGVSSTGNDDYDPVIAATGFDGTTEGPYDLRFNFRADADRTLRDITGTDFDGDTDGAPGGSYNFWFKSDLANTLFVDKAAGGTGSGTLASPFTRINAALTEAESRAQTAENVIVRIVGNSGQDGLIETVADNLAYEIGFNNLGNMLADGSQFDVPRGVTVMIDSGAVLKLRRSSIVVGSSSPVVDRSASALQLLGTPAHLDSAGRIIRDEVGNIIPGSVYLTSIHDTEIGVDSNPDNFPPLAASGDWGGISFRNDIDSRDANRTDLEGRGVFLNYVNHAQLHYGGGNAVVDGVSQVVTPIHMVDARPTATFNTIRHSADAAMSASPDSFEETNFHAPKSQFNPFTSDYQRIGPEIHRNTTVDNSINGLFIQISTPAGNQLLPLTVSGRWDDTDIAHIVAENLVIQGTPGGPIQEIAAPPVEIVALRSQGGGELMAGTYNYRVTFVDAAGNEGAPSDPTAAITITGDPGDNSIRLDYLPPADAGFVARRIYRSANTGLGPYVLANEINASSSSYIDDGSTIGGELQVALQGLRARTDGSLAIDPGLIVKLNGGAIEARFGGQLIAEGLEGGEIVFTSSNDDRFGGSGTFDTTNNGAGLGPAPGDWGGLFIGHVSRGSIDHAQVAYGGGEVRIEGNFTGLNAIEVHQAEARIAHTVFEHNADGTGGQATPNRAGRGSNAEALIFVRGAQPVILDNLMLNNDGPVININVNALNSEYTTDPGRTTFNRGEDIGAPLDRKPGFGDNEGPLVRLNRVDLNDVNGMVVRGGTLNTQSVWDDTDIVHVIRDQTIYVPDFHTFGGLRLESSPTESLVVKLKGPTAGITATGRPLDIEDRIGGSLHVVGQANHPVVLTSIEDCTVGAGFTPGGVPQNDTLNRGFCGSIDTVLGPMIDQFTDTAPNIDEWFIVADSTRTVSVELFEADQAVIAIDAQNPITVSPNETVTISLEDVTPGSTHVFTHELIGSLSHYRPRFIGASQVYLVEDRTSPNDVFNSASGTGTSTGSNLELGFDRRFDTLPSVFADTTWFYQLDEGDDFTWRGFFDDFPGGADAVQIDLLDPSGNVVQTAATQPLLPGAGTTFTATVPAGQAGFWAVTLVAPDVVAPFAGHYLMDVEVTDAQGVRDPDKSERHYLLNDSFINSTFGLANPGDWGSVTIDSFANDRNVGVVTEVEAPDLAAPGNNSRPNDAQFVGALAPHEKGGDDNLRLGVEIHGLISEATDIDVYGFNAEAGTEVFFDIDRTDFALDSVVELVDANGTAFAISDNGAAEVANPSLQFHRANVLPDNHVNPLAKSDFDIPDRYTVNPKDAGMRVVLPGPVGSTNTYYVRIRSSSGDLNNLSGGLTDGPYQLQLRLRELDEVPGSTVRHSDIRFATNGIQVFGQPTHSPLLSEVTEALDASGSDVNDSLGTAQELGNILNADLGTIGVAGEIDLPDDVDWFRFTADFDSARQQSVEHGSFIFDVDYADGLARSNTNLWVFDEQGNLIMSARDSNVSEDRPGPLAGSDSDDLSRGSLGPLDPYLGPTELPVFDAINDGIYYVAISSNAVMPDELQQFLEAVPTNPLFRLEPINALNRIAEEHFEDSGFTNNLSNIARPPEVPVLFDTGSIVEFNLGDVSLFVAQDTGANQTGLLVVDPFTGAVENRVGRINANLEDVTLHPASGQLFGLNTFEGRTTDTNSGDLHQIEPRSEPAGGATVTTTVDLSVNLGNIGIQTNNDDPTNPGTVIRSANGDGVGIHFDAIAIGQNSGQDGTPGLAGYAVGNRAPGFNVGLTRNLLYEFDINSGAGISDTPPGHRGEETNPLSAGAWTNVRERASLDTTVDPIGPGNTVVLGAEATIALPRSTTFNITDAQGSELPGAVTFTIDDGTGLIFQFEFNAGPEVRFVHNPNSGTHVRDGDRFFLDGEPQEFDTGSVIVVTANGTQVQDGDTITITEELPSGGNPPISVTRFFEFDLFGGVSNANYVPIPFSRADNNLQMINRIVTAISDDSFNVEAVAVGQRISLIGESQTAPAQENAAGTMIIIEGAPGVGAGAIRILVEESFGNDEFGDAVDVAIGGIVDASRDGQRINFSGARLADFSSVVTRGVFTDIGSDGRVNSGFIPVSFLAADTAGDIASRMADAINLNTSITAIPIGAGVQLQNGATVTAATDPLIIGGNAPGGDITGMAFVGTQIYAVTNTGGLYRIRSPESNSFGVFGSFCAGACADYVETSTDLLSGDNGNPIRFMGLTAGPRNAENGRYANMLFGIDVNGLLWAFDTSGRLQPAFVDGQTNVATGLDGVTGLAFSNLDYNLWHFTDQRRNDSGHGVDPVFDGSRRSEIRADNDSIYFGYENANRNGIPGNQFTNPVNQNDYDFAGGAAGSLISNEFSLAGYAPEDRPTLYFNYYLATEGTNAANPLAEPRMKDALRAFVSGDDGEWHLLTTNNSNRIGTDQTFPPDDEFDDPELFDGIDVEVQETFDVGDSGAPDSWRQARVSLDDFAGQENLRLRFDFSTGGGMGPTTLTDLLGNLRRNTVGHELRTIEAIRLHDGQSFSFTPLDPTDPTQPVNDVFELDFGFSLNSSTGAAIPDDAFFTIDGTNYLFDSDGSLGGNFLAVAGLAVSDGDTFQVSDGTNTSTFEFEDTSVANPDGVASGNVDVPFTPVDSAEQMAVLIADAINRSGLVTTAVANLQTVELTGGSPSFRPGTTGLRPPNTFVIPYSGSDTSFDMGAKIERMILNNPPPVPVIVGNLSSNEPNDVLNGAISTFLTGNTAIFRAEGSIGDNVLQDPMGLDVDVVKFELQIGDQVTIDVDADAIGTGLDSILRLFNSSGNQLARSFNNAGPGEPASADPFIAFTAPVTGTYFAAVSGHPNFFYNPQLAGSGIEGDTGDYSLEVTVTGAGGLIHRAGHRINFPNASAVSGNNMPANFIEGAPGTQQNGFAVSVNLGMNANAVADAVATSLASFYANGSRPAFKTYENIVRLTGHAPVAQSLGLFGEEQFGLTGTLFGDEFGAFEASTRFDGTINNAFPSALKLQDNLHEGIYLDDLIIGFAERGEMVTGASGSTTFVTNTAQPDDEIDEGAYQLEIRRAPEFGLSANLPLPTLFFTRSFDTNDRLTEQLSVEAPPGSALADGQVFTLSDGIDSLTFEFDDLNLPPGDADLGVQPGNVRVPFLASQSSNEIAELIRDRINSAQSQSLLDVTAGLADGTTTGLRSSSNVVNLYGNATLTIALSEAGVAGAINNVSAFLSTDLFTFDNLSTTGEQIDSITLTLPSPQFFDFLDPLLDPNDPLNAGSSGPEIDLASDFVGATFSFSTVLNMDDTIRIDFTDFDPTETFIFGVDVDPSNNPLDYIRSQYQIQFSSGRSISGFFTAIGAGAGEVATLDVAGNLNTVRFEDFGDTNIERQQGQILIEANSISNVLQFGIVADAGTRDISALASQAGQLPHAGPVRVTSKLNGERLVTGVTLTNNLIYDAGVGGIHFSGDPNPAGEQLASIPFGRIVNNTIVGREQVGIGIDVDENASPTLLNNLLIDLSTGIRVDSSSSTTVVGASVYQLNATNTDGVGLGSFPIQLSDTDPLFVDKNRSNFYLAPGSRAIDSGIDSLQDRQQLLSVKQPLGLMASPILAPDNDVLGQRRVDDPSVDTPPGQGANVFKDRGALDRADFSGPTAVLLTPRDNDSLGRDQNGADTIVELVNDVLPNFSLQLLDGVEPNDTEDGTGPDDGTVRGSRVSILRDGVQLVQGLDYTFNFDATNNIVRLTPLAGIWERDRVYDIDLSNSEGIILTAPNGTEIADGDQFSATDQEGNVVLFEYESGYTLQVPQTLTIEVPAGGGTAVGDGDMFVIGQDGVDVIFEFDTNGVFVDADLDTEPDNTLITFSLQDSANDIANKIVAAIQTASLNVSPVNIVDFSGRAVHLGSTSIHTLDTSQTVLTQSGQAGGVEDGQTFTIDDGSNVVTFIFSLGGGNATTDTRPIAFSHSQTHEQIAASVAASIRGAGIGLPATYADNSEGLIHVGGTRRHIINTAPQENPDANSNLILAGMPGVQPELGIKIPTVAGRPDFETIMDAETFVVSDGTNSVTFELDIDGEVTPGNRVITFNTLTSTNQLANAIAIAVRDANLGLTPANTGDGEIIFNATASHSLNADNTSLSQIGQPGVAASRPVFFTPGDGYIAGVQRRDPIFSANQMAGSIATAINTANAVGLFSDVAATPRDDQVILDGVVDTDATGSVVRSNIRDIAGNPLKPNRTDGNTRFTIFIGSGQDYGDAPLPYPTLESANGARHEVIGEVFLGNTVDVDIDGQPSINADGDDLDTPTSDEDGVVFNDTLIGGSPSQITVTANRNGLLDAWIDYNGDGDWNDPGEQVFVTESLATGANLLTINVPADVSDGETYARFRLSSRGGLGPTGSAADGEVEDYRVVIEGSPWTNAANTLDVNGDGVVAPVDALLIINELNRRMALGLSVVLPVPFIQPNPPRFYDVNGNTVIDTNDAIRVIDRLNAIANGEGEGEGSGRPALVTNALTETEAKFSQSILVDHRVPVLGSDRGASSERSEINAVSSDLLTDRWRTAVDRTHDRNDDSRDGGIHAEALEDLLEHLGSQTDESDSRDEFFANL